MAVTMRLLLSLLLLKASCAPPSCAGDDQEARECGAPRGFPRKCCAGLKCLDGVKCGTPSDGGGDETNCPSKLLSDCISWTISGGRCQALHYIIRIVDEHGVPVNGAQVKYMTATPTGRILGPNTKVTSAGLFSSYVDDMPKYCDSDEADGTIDAVCFQKASVGFYNAQVLDVTFPGCESTYFDPLNSPVTYSEFEYRGRGCQKYDW